MLPNCQNETLYREKETEMRIVTR